MNQEKAGVQCTYDFWYHDPQVVTPLWCLRPFRCYIHLHLPFWGTSPDDGSLLIFLRVSKIIGTINY